MRSGLVLFVLGLVACDQGVIDQPTYDAPPPPVDAMAVNYLGQPCVGTPPQGDCPSGWECLTQPGGNGAWCTKSCTGQQDPSCNAGYAGPGMGSCILTPAGRSDKVCTIVCRDTAGGPTLCPTGEDCNGSCPAPLQCQSDIIDNTTMTVVGQSCS